MLTPRYVVATRINGRPIYLGETMSPGLAADWNRAADSYANFIEQHLGAGASPSDETIARAAVVTRRHAAQVCEGVL